MKSRLRLITFAGGSIFISIFVMCFLIESVLRFFPVNEGLASMPVNEESPILRFAPERTSVWSRNWNFSRRNVVRTNNYGFLSNIAYEPHAPTPLVAIIGDSYIEAAMIPWEQTGAARLQQQLDRDWRVYAFGASGSALSQYLAYAAYVSQEFAPDVLVIVIVGNDFDESLLKYKKIPGFHYFVENDDDDLMLQRIDYEPGLGRRLLRSSALGMYVVTNLQIARAIATLKQFGHRETFVGNTAANVDDERIVDSQKVVDTFLAELPTMSRLDPADIILVVDGIRPQLYDEEALQATKGSYYDIMRRYVLHHAKEQGFSVVDMQPIFIEHYHQHGRRFEFPDDGHWNRLGHELFADAVKQSKALSSLE